MEHIIREQEKHPIREEDQVWSLLSFHSLCAAPSPPVSAKCAGGVAASAAQNSVHAAAPPPPPWPASLERLLKCGRGCSLCSHHRNNSSLSDVHSRHVLHTRLRKYVRAFATLVHITEDFQLTSNELENQSRKKLFFTGCKC